MNQVPSASEGLTTVFGMGTGVTPLVLLLGITVKKFGVIQIRAYMDNDVRHDRFSRINFLAKIIPLNPPMTNISQAERPISTSQLRTLLLLHSSPINLVVFQGSSKPVLQQIGNYYLGDGLALRCFQRLSYPNLDTQHVLLTQ